MNQSELIAKVAAISGQPKKAVEAILKSTTDVITSTLVDGGEVTLPGIGKLGTKTSKPRAGRNPKTGAPVDIPAKRRPTFTASKVLKDAISK